MFYMIDCKPLGVLISMGTNLLVEQCPATPNELEDMDFFPYANSIGSLMYVMVCTRLDIAQEVGVLSRFMANTRFEHWVAVKRVFNYLQGTSKYFVCYQCDASMEPHSMDI